MTNPLLDTASLPRFGDILPEHVAPALSELIAAHREKLNELLDKADDPTFESLVAPLEEMDHEIADHIAQAYHKLGKHEDALRYIKKAAELNPDHEAIKKRLEEYSKAAKK